MFWCKKYCYVHFPNQCFSENLPEDAKKEHILQNRVISNAYHSFILKKWKTSDHEDKAVAFGGWKQFDLFNFKEQKLILLRRNQNRFSVKKRDHFNGTAKINQAESKLDLTTKKNTGQQNGGKRIRGRRNAKQQILFFKKRRKEREREILRLVSSINL